MLSLLMMGMLLSYGFSSTLTSCLASKGNSVALDDLEDVAVKRTHSLCVRNNSGAYRHFTVVRIRTRGARRGHARVFFPLSRLKVSRDRADRDENAARERAAMTPSIVVRLTERNKPPSSSMNIFTRDASQDSRPDSELQDKWKGLVNKDCPDMMDTRTLASKMCRPGFVYLEVPGVFLPIYRAVEHICELLQLQKTHWERKMSFMHLRMAPHRRLIDA
jgi:hypothetical protein